MIEIKKFKLTANQYYKVIMRLHFKKNSWMYVILLLIALSFSFTEEKDGLKYFIIVMGYTYFPIYALYLYFWVHSKKNQSLFSERIITFNDIKLFATVETGSYSEIPLNQVLFVVEQKDCILLYLSKAQFIYIPKSAFEKPEDLESFRNSISKSS